MAKQWIRVTTVMDRNTFEESDEKGYGDFQDAIVRARLNRTAKAKRTTYSFSP